MNVDMTRNLAFTVRTTCGWTATVVQKRGSVSEHFSHGLENEFRSQIDSETWGDNNARGDNKVDNKVDNNARGDIKVDNKVDNNAGGDNKVDNKVDNNVWDDTVNETVKHPQIRLRTITPYNTRTRPVQHPRQPSVKVWLTHEQISLLLGRDQAVVANLYNLAYRLVVPKHIMEAA